MVVPVDPATGDYGPLQLAAGEYTATAAASGYLTGTAQVTIAAGLTTTQNFDLYRPAIEVAPPALTVAALPEFPVTLPLTLTNAGHLPLHVQIVEDSRHRAAPAAGASLPGRQPPAAAGIDPLIARQMALAPGGRARVFVAFKEGADLSAASAVPGKSARVRAVRAALRQAADRAQAGVRAWLERRGIDYRVFAVDNTLLVTVDAALLEQLAALPGVSGLRANHTYRLMPIRPAHSPAPDAEIPWDLINMRVPEVWQQGITGRGAIVANVDTGVDYQHESLFPGYLCGSGPHAACWLDPEGGTTVPNDAVGHGTMLMSQTAGSNDPALPYSLGVAPGAGWIACQGCRNGACTDYALNACADWLLMGTPYTPDVIDHGWGAPGTCGDPWYSAKLLAYRAAGILAIFAAGDEGPACSSDVWPANDAGAFAVGASTPEDLVTYFSSAGPGSCGKLQYPDVIAPGLGLCAADAGGGYVCDLGGTCLSSALAAGCAALVKSAAPQLTADPIADVLRSSAYSVDDTSCGSPQPDPNYRWGDGRVDCLSAVSAVHDPGLPWLWTQPVSATVPPQASLPVSVTFQCTITDVGHILTGTLRVEHDDPCAGPVDVPVELRCTDQVAPGIELSLSSLAATLCGGTWAATTFGLCNIGTAPLDWTLDEVPPAGWVSESPPAGTLAPNACRPVEVTFDATALPPGTYATALHVASNDPDEPDIALPLTLTVPIPAQGASFEWSPPEPVVGQTVVFTGSVAAGDPPLLFSWAFGDGAAGSGQSAPHIYASPGPYTVTLSVRNGCGEAQAVRAVTVRPAPPVDRFVYLPLVCKGH
jgi:hypothetical protein